MNRYREAVYIMGALMIVSQVPAHAYIDGGTGSYVIQVAIAMFLGVGYAFKASISRVLSRIRHSGRNSSKNTGDDSQ